MVSVRCSVQSKAAKACGVVVQAGVPGQAAGHGLRRRARRRRGCRPGPGPGAPPAGWATKSGGSCSAVAHQRARARSARPRARSRCTAVDLPCWMVSQPSRARRCSASRRVGRVTPSWAARSRSPGRVEPGGIGAVQDGGDEGLFGVVGRSLRRGPVVHRFLLTGKWSDQLEEV